MVKHIIEGITTLCGRTLSDENWPVDHNWAAPDKHEEATCAKCRGEAGLSVTSEHFLDQIDTLYAFTGCNHGGEGILSLPIGVGGSEMLLIAADKTRMNDLKPFVQKMAAQDGMHVRLVQFTGRKVVEEFMP